ncbi:efflux RND transporter permease subunit [Marinicella sp. W31]|uniref:efflux RND transporter permease subunit n=1 Tax=Marinicella sp. W31 TaxID=3023713 RepID=UPI003757A009
MKKQWNTGIIYWFANNPVAANLLMVSLLVAGLYAAFTLKKDVFPSTEANVVSITVAYPGAAPEEVEEGICVKIEDAVTGLEGIEKTTCRANEGSANTSIEIETDYDINNVMAEIKNRVDSIFTFPEQAEKPIVSQLLIRQPVMFVSVFGDLNEADLVKTATNIKDEILDLPGVSLANLVGNRDFEIALEIKETTLRKYQLTFDEVARAVRESSLDLPGGSVKTDRGDVLLRSIGQAYTGQEFADVIIRTNPDGSQLRLSDIADIKDGFVERGRMPSFDGKPAISIQIDSVEEDSALNIADEVNAFVARKKSELPPQISLDVWSDTSHYLRGRLDMMQRNMVQGAIMVLLILTLFLRLKVAFWVMVGLPIAFLGAFTLLPMAGVSINMLSLFGFILVLGIVVDDAIVIGESAYREVQDKGHSLENVVVGAQRVATPATFGVLTTVAAFVPMLFVGTIFGSFFEAIGWVVVLCLLFSLVESKLILPAHLAHMKSSDIGTDNPGLMLRIQRKVNATMQKFIRNQYIPTIRKAIKRPFLTLVVFISLLSLSFGLISNGFVRFVVFPDFIADYVSADFAMAQGTPQRRTNEVLEHVEEALVQLDRDVSQQHGQESGLVFNHRYAFSANQTSGQVIVELVKEEQAVINGKEMLQMWRDYIGDVAGITHIGTLGFTGPGQGPDIDFKLVGKNIESLRLAADEIAQLLKREQGVSDIRNSIESGKDEIQFQLKDKGRNLGLTQSDLGRQIRQAYYGEEVQRLQRDNDEVKVMLRYTRDIRESIGSLQEVRIRTPQGDAVPLATVADIKLDKAANMIERVDRSRAARLTAMVDKAVADPQDIIRRLQSQEIPKILAKYPGISLGLDGMAKALGEVLVALGIGMLAAVLLIYMLIAIPLKSYAQPLIIMSIIPFGITGAIIGHWITGYTFNMMSIFGVIALSGVVVNDSLVMVDFVNKERASGKDLVTAVTDAGSKRFRAILLTSLTTFFGLVPILLETSLQAKVIIPMGISLAFGILFATVITLILIPALYVALENLKSFSARRRKMYLAQATAINDSDGFN